VSKSSNRARRLIGSLPLIAVSCGGPHLLESRSQPQSSVETFIAILTRGEFVYGIGPGCQEWKAQPEMPGRPSGRLEVTAPDKEGRLHEFGYYLRQGTHTLELSGRGSWYPAPGVIVPANREGYEGYALIGRARLCTEVVDVQQHPQLQDAVLVGGETWYLSRDTCLRFHTAHVTVRPSDPGCS
jgi:hypothetical protein